MEAYEKEVFTFFTSEKNFLNLCKMVGHYPKVLNQLKEEFWELTLNKIDLKLKAGNSGFVVKKSGQRIDDFNTKIMIYKPEWLLSSGMPLVAIVIQRLSSNTYPFYGPWVNNDSKEYDLANIYATLQNSSIAGEFENDKDKWFPFFDDVGIDFKSDEECLKILPDRRDEFAESIADRVIDLSIRLESDLYVAASMAKPVI